jgi:hypothetical protein
VSTTVGGHQSTLTSSLALVGHVVTFSNTKRMVAHAGHSRWSKHASCFSGFGAEFVRALPEVEMLEVGGRCRGRHGAQFGFGGDVDMIRIADEAARERRHVGQHDLLDRVELLLVRERIARHLLCQFGDPCAERSCWPRAARPPRRHRC